VVGANSTILPTDDVDGFDGVPIKVKLVPGKGRGIFAARDIPKGKRIWTAHYQMACFYDPHSFRRFLAAIPSNELVCDVLQWSYAVDYGDEGRSDLRMCTPLDQGALVNTNGRNEEANIGCVRHLAKEHEGGCRDNDFAFRTIRAGEEILGDYSEFVVPGGWSRFGM
jgi:hypothetical protein